MKEGKSDRTHWIPEDAFGGSIDPELLEGVSEALKGSSPKAEWEHFTPEFIGTKAQTLNLNALYREMGSAQRRFQEARISQPEGKVSIQTDLPASVFFVGDVHFGSVYTDHRRFLKEMKEVTETPNTYVVFMSNLIDNAIPSQFPSNMLVNSIPPDKQVVAMRSIVQDLDKKGKVLGAVTSDCHEGWTWRHTGQDINALIYGYEDRNFPVLENGGRLDVRLGKEKYLLALYHKIGPFRSNFNYTHGLKQMNRLKQSMEADVVVGAHYHVAGVEEVYDGDRKGKKQHVYIQSGTYKGVEPPHDQWAVAKFGSTGHPSAQSVTLFPDKKRMDAHLEFDTGMLAHESYYVGGMAKKTK